MDRSIPLALLACLVAAPAAHAAGPEAGRWSATLFGGADVALSGDLHGGTDAPVANLGPLNPALDGVSAVLEIGSRSYDDVYGSSGWTLGGELAYGYSDAVEAYVRVAYGELSADRLQVGNAFVPALNARLPVFGEFDDRTAFAATVGARYWGGGAALRPYVGANVGFASLESVNATFTIPDAAITLRDVRFHESSTEFTGAIEVGLGWSVTETLALDFNVAAQYTGAPDGDDRDIGGLGLASINDVDARWSVPVTLGVRFRF